MADLYPHLRSCDERRLGLQPLEGRSGACRSARTWLVDTLWSMWEWIGVRATYQSPRTADVTSSVASGCMWAARGTVCQMAE